MKAEIDTLETMKWWDIVDRPVKKKVLHSEPVLKKKRHESGEILKHKTGFVVCGNKEVGYEDHCFSPVAEFTPMKLITYLSMQRR